MNAILSGRCLCGEVTVSLTPAKTSLGACHCEMCRRWTGSAFVTIGAAPGSLSVTGPVRTFKSSDWAERSFCGTCGSTLWYHLVIPGHQAHFVAAGLFDDAGGLTLDDEIYIDSKPAGYGFAGDHKRMTKAEVEATFASYGEGE